MLLSFKNILFFGIAFIIVSCKQNESSSSSRTSSSYLRSTQSSSSTTEASNGDVVVVTQGTEIGFPAKYRQSFSPSSYIAGYINFGVDSSGKTMRGLYMRPGGILEAGPLLIAIHGTSGLDDAFIKLLLRYLSSSTQILALDLYSRVPKNFEEAQSFEKILNDKPLAELIAFVQLAMLELRKKSTKLTQFMLMGWGEGGRRAIDLALLLPDISMLINYYGYPFALSDKVDLFKIPMLGYFVQEDSSIPVSRIVQLEKALVDNGNKQFKKVIKPSPTVSGFMDENQEDIYDSGLTSEVVEESINLIRTFSINQ